MKLYFYISVGIAFCLFFIWFTLSYYKQFVLCPNYDQFDSSCGENTSNFRVLTIVLKAFVVCLVIWGGVLETPSVVEDDFGVDFWFFFLRFCGQPRWYRNGTDILSQVDIWFC